MTLRAPSMIIVKFYSISLTSYYRKQYFRSREVDVVLTFLKEKCGSKHIGAVGFCWGGVVTHYLALLYPGIKAGVSVYGT